MGYFSSSQTQTTKTADLSDRGNQFDSLFMSMLEQNLSEYGGYDVTTTQKTKYSDPEKATNIKNQIADLDGQIADLQSQSKEGVSGVNSGGRSSVGLQGVQGKIDALKKKKDNLNNQLTNMPSSTYEDFDLKKKEDPTVQAAIDKYGANAPEVQTAKEKIKSDAALKLETQNDINASFLKNLQKFANGDMSYTPEQAKQVDAFIAPVKSLIMSTTDDLLKQYGDSDKALRESLSSLSSEIDKTGFAVDDALEAASLQYEKSGSVLMDTLKNVNNDARAKAQFQFDLLSQQADKQAAQQSALLGLPPGSMAEKAAATKMKTDALTQIQLELNARESQGALSIQSGVEGGKQQISLAKVAEAQSQGEKKEGIAKTGLELTQALTGKTEGAIGNRGNALINLEQGKQNMLMNAAYGGLPGQLSGTSQGLSFLTNQANSGLGLQSSLMSPILQQLGVEQNRQLAEATTTTTKNPSFFDSITGLVGAGASAAGAVYGMGGFGTGTASKGITGTGGGGGGLNLNTYVPPTPAFNLGNASSGLTLAS